MSKQYMEELLELETGNTSDSNLRIVDTNGPVIEPKIPTEQTLSVDAIKKNREIEELMALNTFEHTPRYFIQGDEVICRYCRKSGHKVRDCPDTIERCHLCRSDHDPLRCPLADVCYQCYRRGHCKQECPDYINRVARFCAYCDQKGHSTMDCSKKGNTITNALNVTCYHCASDEHFGDFCPRRRSGYIAPSAFDFDYEDIQEYRRRARNDMDRKRSYFDNFSSKIDDRRKSMPGKYHHQTPKKTPFKPKPRYSGGYH